MSDISQLKNGKITPAQFASKVAGEIKANPFASAVEGWLLASLETFLGAELNSSTIAAVIVNEIRNLLQVPAAQSNAAAS